MRNRSELHVERCTWIDDLKVGVGGYYDIEETDVSKFSATVELYLEVHGSWGPTTCHFLNRKGHDVVSAILQATEHDSCLVDGREIVLEGEGDRDIARRT